ncbi:MAG: sodium:solute symporter family protein [Rikenellaceae bacterium]
MEGSEGKLWIALLLLIYTLAVSFIGYRSRQSRSGEDYFLASRSLPVWLLSITFVASWWGGGSAVDLVDVANREGLSSFCLYGIPVLISTALMYLFAAGIRRVGTLSQPELMERRYDSRSALMLSLFIVVFMTIGSAVQVIVVGQFFQSFFGVSYEVGAIVGTLLVLFYSLFGGFRGVVLTDLLQFVFFLFAAIFLFVMAYQSSGGFGEMALRGEALGREGFTSLWHNIGDNVAYILTFGTSWMVQANVWQRISAAKEPRSAKRMMGLSFLLFIPLYLVVTLTGMLSMVSYETPPEGGVVAAMLLSLDSPVLGGLIFVGLCSAIMSTMDSMFNTGALTLAVDIYGRHIKGGGVDSQSYVRLGRWATFVIAAISLFIGVQIRSVLTISWIGADFIASGAFVSLVAGFVWRRGTSIAAFVSMLFGLLFSSYNLLVTLGVNLPVGWEIASTTQAIVGLCSSAVIYVVVSLLTLPDYERADRFIGDARVLNK